MCTIHDSIYTRFENGGKNRQDRVFRVCTGGFVLWTYRTWRALSRGGRGSKRFRYNDKRVELRTIKSMSVYEIPLNQSQTQRFIY